MKSSKIVIFSLLMLISSANSAISIKRADLDANYATEARNVFAKEGIKQLLDKKYKIQFNVKGISVINSSDVAAVATDAGAVIINELSSADRSNKDPKAVATAVVAQAAKTYAAEKVVAFIKFAIAKTQAMTGISTPACLQGDSNAAYLANLALTTSARAVAATVVNSVEAKYCPAKHNHKP